MTDPDTAPHAARAQRPLDDDALATLFVAARTPRRFVDRPVPRATLDRIVELAHLGPTSNNVCPMRVRFVESRGAKERLRPALSPGNVEKTMHAPVTAIVALDRQFYDLLAVLAPGRDLRARLTAPERAAATAELARTNAIMQGAYFMLAARALGLDAGPMGGFDRAMVDAVFFPEGRCESLWLVNIGYGDDAALEPRAPRLPLDEIRAFL